MYNIEQIIKIGGICPPWFGGTGEVLGKFIRIKVTNPVGSLNSQLGYTYKLNYGTLEGRRQFDHRFCGAYIMGINHPVRNFDGRVIAVLRRSSEKKGVLVVAPKNAKFIEYQIVDAISFAEPEGSYRIECLYERSCGAIVCRKINGETRLLLIKNSRSAHWGFPKGHMERGETPEQTAKREVLEETGLNINIIPDFSSKSDYTIQGKVEKSVTIFLAETEDTKTVIQREEIDDYIWLGFDKAMETLKFENDKAILKNARRFVEKHKIFD